ncbi:MAG: hypothetical protein HQ483_17300 [Rhodospirillales bacterium]|nr:hypothetical protein [Rhodospirillales bacterium]
MQQIRIHRVFIEWLALRNQVKNLGNVKGCWTTDFQIPDRVGFADACGSIEPVRRSLQQAISGILGSQNNFLNFCFR